MGDEVQTHDKTYISLTMKTHPTQLSIAGSAYVAG